MDFATGGASAYHQGPISPDSWKRAVYRSAPQNFYVGVLTPEKQGGSYSYGLRICPFKDDNASISTHSTSSKGSHLEYEIWRKWEDCLWFQDTIEAEYTLMAREKRTRLAAGKGVKKDGMYIQSDQAASFESLPPGPDPQSVARDIHQYIPKLTKKGTLFRASQATIDQRFKEFSAMINAFFQDELPTLVKELMATRTFTDFFGYWRRDHDLALKTQKNQTPPAKPRRSVSSSMLSAYFYASTPALADMPSVNGSHKLLPKRGSGTSDSLSSETSLQDQPTARSRMNSHPAGLTISLPSRSSKSTLSSSSSSSNSPSPVTPRRSGRTPMIVTHEAPMKFGHNPQHTSDGYASERQTSILQALPEDREVEISKAASTDYSQMRRRAGSASSEAIRNGTAFVPRPESSSDLSDDAEFPSDVTSSRHDRCSWLSTSSVSQTAAYLAELGVDLTLPHPHPERAHRPRASMCSMASYRTDASADAIIPRSALSQSSALQRPPSSGTRQHRHSMPFPDEEEWVEREPWANESAYGEEDLLDTYFSDAITPASFASSQTSSEDSHFYAHQYPSSTYVPRRASITTSISSGSTGCSDGSAIAIKAMHENSIIMLRIPRSLSFMEVRHRLYDKFVRQEGLPLSESFVVALVVPALAIEKSGGRPYAGSLSSASADNVVLHFVKSNDDWDQAIYKYGNKVSLRVIGSRA
ncbi:uncharacterized protein EDB91DRAFT_457581 [Suillus paluster]|uniref:uncharacterized protein n=1 Tax=Suillus paluster TaxID=48578 RepID=UPI001B8637CC|nr:uncharacterized protein EDB91DRAFT_457581 [Suillus paluster]KAG1738381.1 hypothetical protein EDB91DRAFT_457581 [Suillus paluster]